MNSSNSRNTMHQMAASAREVRRLCRHIQNGKATPHALQDLLEQVDKFLHLYRCQDRGRPTADN